MISTIAHAMRSFQRRSKSSTLQANLARLESFSPSPLGTAKENDDMIVPDGHRLVSNVKARLWGIMQKKLYNLSAARRLKPIMPKENTIHLQEPDEMLDESSMPSSGTDFESLFEDSHSLDTDRGEGYSDDDILNEFDGPDINLFLEEGLEDHMLECEETSKEITTYADMEDLEMLDGTLTRPSNIRNGDYASQHLSPLHQSANHDNDSNNSPDSVGSSLLGYLPKPPNSEDGQMVSQPTHRAPSNEASLPRGFLLHADESTRNPSSTHEEEDMLFAAESNIDNFVPPSATMDEDAMLFATGSGIHEVIPPTYTNNEGILSNESVALFPDNDDDDDLLFTSDVLIDEPTSPVKDDKDEILFAVAPTIHSTVPTPATSDHGEDPLFALVPHHSLRDTPTTRRERR